jgi:hypothetical protein
VLYRLRKNVSRFIKATASIKQVINLRPVARTFLDFAEIAHIRDQRVVGFLVGAIGRHFINDSNACQRASPLSRAATYETPETRCARRLVCAFR